MPTEQYNEGEWSGLSEVEAGNTPIGTVPADEENTPGKGNTNAPGKGNTDEQTQNVSTNTDVKNEIRPRTKLERLIDKIAGGNPKVTPKTKIERLLERISSRLDKIESDAASGDVLKSAIKNSGIGYVAPGEALIENAQCTEEGPVYVSPAVIELVPGEELTLHVSIPELGIDEDMTATVIHTGAWYVEKLYNEGESSEYAIVVKVSSNGTSNGFYCAKMAGKTGQKSLPVFSISMPGEIHKISPEMIDREAGGSDDLVVHVGFSGTATTPSGDGVWDKTYEEIKQAFSANKTIQVIALFGSEMVWARAVAIEPTFLSDNTFAAQFVYGSSTVCNLVKASLNASNTASVTIKKITTS